MFFIEQAYMKFNITFLADFLTKWETNNFVYYWAISSLEKWLLDAEMFWIL